MNKDFIVHLADVHIKNAVRHSEYKKVFQYTLDLIKKINPLAIVIVGDLFHNKLMLSPDAFRMALNLIDDCSKIAPTVIIPGNHDVNINNIERRDGISVIVERLNNPNIFYFKKNGLYEFEIEKNIIFGIFSMIDNVNPEPIEFTRQEGKQYIALYHGSLQNSINEDGWKFDGVDLATFKNYDLVLLGDIHKYQYLNKEKTIAYCGSLIQQDSGESIEKGFLVWNIKTKESTFVKVPNEYIYLKIKEEELPSLKFDHLKNKKIHVKFVASQERDTIGQEKIEVTIRDFLSKNKNEILSYSYDIHDESKEISLDSNLENISDVNVQNVLLTEYLKKGNVSDNIIEKCLELNFSFNSQIEKTDFNISQWIPENLKFSNFFGYGEKNEFDIQSFRGVTGIFGKNESGKTSIFETLYYAIFGSTYRNTSLDNLINFSKNGLSSEIILNSNSERYKIIRNISLKDNGTVNSTVKIENLSNPLDESLPAGKVEIKNWIRKKFGLEDDFATTSLSNQFNIQNFVNSKSSDRSKLLLRFLGLDIFEKLLLLSKPRYNKLNEQVKFFKKDEILKSFSDSQLIIARNLETLKEKTVELNNFESKIADLEKEINDNQNLIQNIVLEEIDILDLDKKISEKNKDIQKNVEQINLFQNQIQIYDQFDLKQKNELKLELIELEENIKKVSDSINKNSLDLSLTNEKISDSKKASEIIDSQEWCRTTDVCKKCVFLKDAFEKEKNYDNLLNNCEDVKSEIEKLNINNSTFQKNKENVLKTISLIEKSIEIENKNNLLKSKISNLELINQSLKNDIEANEKKKQNFVDNSLIIESNNLIKEKIINLKNELVSNKGFLKNLNNQITDLKVDLKIHNGKIEEINKKLDDLNKIEEEFLCYETYISAVHRDGLPKSILLKYINEINSKINNVLNNIVDWRVKFEINGDDVELMVIKNDGFKQPADQTASGMQVTLIGLAIRAALVLTSRIAKCKILFLDEPIGAFDSEKQKDVVKVFDYLKSLFSSIFVISHVELYDICNNIIQIEKEVGGFAKIIKN